MDVPQRIDGPLIRNIKELVNAGGHRIHFVYLPLNRNENRLKVDINFGVPLINIHCQPPCLMGPF